MNLLPNLRRALSVAGLALAMSGVAFGQVQSGNVYGDVKDDKGQPLPGVTLTLVGGGAPMIQVTDAQGAFRFLSLSPGTYRLEGSLEGFSPVVYEAVIVNVNRNTTLSLSMNAAVEETITITAESPLLDPRKVSTGATIDKTELEKIPTARDPWVILQTTPGVQIDRVNVGGNESGQQSTYVGHGDDGTNSSWSVDGVEITDVGAIGSSSSYYDFDAFEEMQVSTGGSDASSRVGGVGINLVTKRGTNEWRGSGRYLKVDSAWQSKASISNSDFGVDFDGVGPVKAQAAFNRANAISQIEDYGGEIGGPIVKDRLWVWGSYGKSDIGLLTVAQTPDNTFLETWNAKINGQIASNNSASMFFSNNDKVKNGRGAGPTKPPETTWDQGAFDADSDVFSALGFGARPSVAKIEDTHIFGSSFFLTGMYSEVSGGFSLTPQGGIDGSKFANNDRDGIWHDTYLFYASQRPQDQYKLDGSYFFSTGDLNHELKFGVNRREAQVLSITQWPGGQLSFAYLDYGFGYYNLAILARDGGADYEVNYTNAYVQDTLTSGNLTVNVGARWDKQDAAWLTETYAASPIAPSLLPAMTVQGQDAPFEWSDVQPRLGLTYALGEEKKTLLRASYSTFAEQLGGGTAGSGHPAFSATYFYVYAPDLNNDQKPSPSEVAAGIPLGGNSFYNSDDPSQPSYSNRVDSNLTAPINSELTLGVEHSLLPEFVVGATFVYRQETDLLENEQLVFDSAADAADPSKTGRKHQRSDYILEQNGAALLPDGTAVTVPIYKLRPGVYTRFGNLTENSDSEREYMGVELTFNKRLSNRWMMRGNFSWNDWTWKQPDSEREDPTGFSIDGERVAIQSTGSGDKGNVFMSAAWTYNVTGMYQIAPDAPWGFNVAGSINGREGNAIPYTRRFTASNNASGRGIYNLTAAPDKYKADDVHTLDLRIEKEIRVQDFGLTLGVDCFNVFNESTVLQRQRRMDLSTANHIYEVLSPRVFRVGARISFN